MTCACFLLRLVQYIYILLSFLVCTFLITYYKFSSFFGSRLCHSLNTVFRLGMNECNLRFCGKGMRRVVAPACLYERQLLIPIIARISEGQSIHTHV